VLPSRNPSRTRSVSLHTEPAGALFPDAFGPFRVLHQIGAGALGPVFRAYEPDQDRLVAVKWFRLDIPPEQTHRLVAEFEKLIAADLTHPGVAAPIAAGISGASAYFAQDFVAADSLDLVVRDHGAMAPRDALRVAIQLGAALDFAAAVDVAHGALHPRDVLISADDTRVIGLGVAAALERVGVATPVRRPYTAPERTAPGPWDRRADVFAIAMLIYELLLGKRATAIGDRAAEAVAVLPGADGPALRSVFACALAEDPAKRFATALGFAEALKEALAADVVETARPGAAGRARARSVSPGPRAAVAATPLLSDLPFESGAALADPVSLIEAAGRADVVVPDLHLHVPAAEVERTPRSIAALARPAIEVDAPLPKAPAPAPQAPALVERVRIDVDKPLDKDDAPVEDLHEGALATTRSAVWPLMLALGVGLVVGFAGGFGVATRSRLTMTGTSDGAPPAASAAPAGAPAAPVPAAAPEPGSQPGPTATANPGAGPPRSGASPALQSAGAAAASGRVTIRSAPAGAHVFVDGRDEGMAPATVRDLSFGTHVVRVAREGYAPEERRIALSEAHAAQSLTVELAPSRDGQNREAAIGREAGQGRQGPPAAPLVIESVSIGEHSVGITRDGYTRWVTAVTVTGGDRARVTASLER